MQMTIVLTQLMTTCSVIEQAKRDGISVTKEAGITDCKHGKQQMSDFHYYDIPDQITTLSVASFSPALLTTGFHFPKKLNLI